LSTLSIIIVNFKKFDIAMPNEILSSIEAARYLGIKPGTLRTWKYKKLYNLPCYKIGRSVKYRLEDLNAFMERNKF